MKEKRKSQKLLSLLLCCAVLISMMPMTAGIAAADTGITTIGPDDPEVTITIKNVEAGKLVQGVTYEVKYKDGTTGAQPQGPFLTETGKTPWSVRGTGRYLMKNSGSANYNDKFCAGMTYQLAIAADSIRNISSEKVKLVFEGSGISVEGNGQRVIAGLSNDRSCYMVYVTIPGEKATHTLHVDPSINHVYKMKDGGSGYEEITLDAGRNLSYPEGTRLKFAVDQDYSVGADGTLKFLKGFVGKSKDSTYSSSPDSKFLGGNLRVVSRETREIVVQMGDRDAYISTEFAKNEGLSKLNVIYLDILPAIENGRRVTVVTPTATEKRGDPKNPADKFATYTITGKTAGEWDPNNGSVYLYKKSTAPNTKTDGNYELSFDLKLNGNYYCSNRSTELFINGRWIPNQYFSEETGSPVYWSIENRKIETLGSSGWEIHITMNDFAGQYYAAGSGYGLGLDAPMDFQKNNEGRYRYGVSGGVPENTTVGAYGSTEAASGQSCTVTFPVNVPQGIRDWNAKHKSTEIADADNDQMIHFTFLQNATGGVFVKDATGGSYSSVPATYAVTTGEDGNVTATATFTPENGKMYRVMGSVAATWNGKIVATTPADNSFIYVKGVAKNYLTGSVAYTSAVRYGSDVNIGRTGALASIDTAKLHYQWQYQNGETWIDISGATGGLLSKEKITESLVGKQIRIKVTADGYEGVIYSEAKNVGKATWNKTPVAPELSYDKINGTVTVDNLKSDQWYLISEKSKIEDISSSVRVWQSERTFNSVEGNKTYYVYTCMGENNAHYMGTVYRYSTIFTGNEVNLTGLALEGYSNRIYVKKGVPLEVKVMGTPANTNKWSNIYFIEQDNTANNITVTVDNGTNNYIPYSTGTLFDSHTITITATGNGTLVASSSPTYGTHAEIKNWQVVVYDNSVNINDAELVDPPTYADVTLSVGDSYIPENAKPTIQTIPADVMDYYGLKWFVMTPAADGSSIPTYSEANAYISVSDDGKVTTKAANAGGENSIVALCAIDKTTGNFVRHITDYKVTVIDATAPDLEKLSLSPNEKTLKVDDAVELTAIKYPANATGNIIWESSNIGVATVDSSTGKVTAVAEGTTTITAKCGEKQTTCTIHVIAADHSHGYGDWTKLDDTFHSKTCTANDDTQVAKHNWIEDSSKTNTEASLGHAGEKHYECSDCGATKTDILSQLTAITDAGVSVTAPAYGDTPSGAYTSSGEFNVANVTWEPAVSGSFAANTVYTVKVELEVSGSNRFTNATQFTINGKSATVMDTTPTADGTESVTLTYKFPVTGSGSSGGGGTAPSMQKPEITIIGSGKADLSADGRTATITADAGNELVSITLNGKEVAKTDKLTGLKTGDKVVITFRKTADDSATITKSIASKVKQMQLNTRSSKTAKKNIQVTVKTDAKTAELIKDIQDLGYTVKYKFYRSTRKSADYKTKVTKAVPKYLNTTGKKGTMYYYKARVMVYDKAGKLVAQSELKQCKYANRKWGK